MVPDRQSESRAPTDPEPHIRLDFDAEPEQEPERERLPEGEYVNVDVRTAVVASTVLLTITFGASDLTILLTPAAAGSLAARIVECARQGRAAIAAN